MHALPLAFCALFFAGDNDAAPAESPEAARAAVVKSLQFLAKDSVDWKEEHKCASCHHVPMTIWALEEGRQAGYAVETAVLDQLTTWVLTDGQARVLPDLEHKNPFNPTIEMAGVYTMLALGLAPPGTMQRALPGTGSRPTSSQRRFPTARSRRVLDVRRFSSGRRR
jgi:hypothetical protein